MTSALGRAGQGVALWSLLLQPATGPSPGSLGTQTWPFCLVPLMFTKRRIIGMGIRSPSVLYVIVLTEQGPSQAKTRAGCCSYLGLWSSFCTPCSHL